MQPNKHYVIRKKTSQPRTLGRICLLTALWVFVAFVIIVNVSFMLHVYSDSLVSFYLLLNLNYQLYGIVVGIIALIVLLVGVYASLRLKQLRGQMTNEEK